MEATPYLLFYPPAPGRVAADLPTTTRFVVLLRDPVQRAISQYWHSRRLHAENEPLEVALALEETRRWPGADRGGGGESFAHRNFSYKARGHYVEQLRRWFAGHRARAVPGDGERGALRRSERARSCARVAGTVCRATCPFPPPTTRPGLAPKNSRSSRHYGVTSPPSTRICSSCWGAGCGRADHRGGDAPAAAHMASTGATRPVHCSRASAAWCTSIPSPPRPAPLPPPRRPGTASARRVVDEVHHHLPGVQRLRSTRDARHPQVPAPHAHGARLYHELGGGEIEGRPRGLPPGQRRQHAARPASGSPPPPRRRRRRPAPASPPAPPPGADHQASPPPGSNPVLAAARPGTRPRRWNHPRGARPLSTRNSPLRAGGHRGALVDGREGRLLVGHGDRQPGHAQRPIPARAAAVAPAGTGKATDTQLSPMARRRRCAEPATGSGAPGRRSRRPPWRPPTASDDSGRFPSSGTRCQPAEAPALRQLLVGLLTGEGVGEGFGAVR